MNELKEAQDLRKLCLEISARANGSCSIRQIVSEARLLESYIKAGWPSETYIARDTSNAQSSGLPPLGEIKGEGDATLGVGHLGNITVGNEGNA